MAGAGYKLFNTGDVLTAAQVNTYLQEQVVMVFADATARTSALSGVLAEGMVSYLKDTNATEVYDGSAWVGIGNSGDITGVTAGTGISGGGTFGTVTITNDMATTITAAGDIVVGTGSGTYDNLPIGTTGQVLTADTTVSPYKVKWASAAGGGGKVLQVVQGTLTSNFSTTSTSYVDSGLTVSITPSATTSKVMVIVSFGGKIDLSGTGTSNGAQYIILRGSTQLQRHPIGYNSMASASNSEFMAPGNFSYLDSPSTTSSTTYKVQVQAFASTNTAYVLGSSTQIASIVAMEIGA